jgi:two-component system chemotaxis response regulator CheB
MKLRTLVVDDTSLFRKVVSDALTMLPDVEVIGTAPNGKIALERIATLKPDLITLDIEMPEMDGLEVLAELKSRGLECGVVVVSAVTLKGGDLTIRALERGAFDFITKPTEGDSKSNLIAISHALAPIVNAYRRRLEIRSILKQTSPAGSTTKTAPMPAPPPARVELTSALKKSGSGAGRHFNRRSECAGENAAEPDCEFPGPHIDRSAHAAFVYEIIGHESCG